MSGKQAAINACCEGWSDEKRSQVSGLQLHDPEMELADRETALARMREIIQEENGQGEFSDNRIFFWRSPPLRTFRTVRKRSNSSAP